VRSAFPATPSFRMSTCPCATMAGPWIHSIRTAPPRAPASARRPIRQRRSGMRRPPRSSPIAQPRSSTSLSPPAASPSPTSASAPALVFFGRAIHLQKGDRERIELLAPDGSAVARNETEPVDRDKAQAFAFAGKKRSGDKWQAGVYIGRYAVLHGDAVVASAD